MAVKKYTDVSIITSESNKTGVVVSFESRLDREMQATEHIVKNDKLPWVSWGKDHGVPRALVAMVNDNAAKPEIIGTTAAFASGMGIEFYRESRVEGKITNVPLLHSELPLPMQQFLDRINADSYLDSAALQFAYFGNLFTEHLLARNGHPYSIAIVDGTAIAPEKRSNGVCRGYYLSADWRKPIVDTKDGEVNTWRVPAWEKEAPQKHPKFIVHGRKGLPGHADFDVPNWYGTREWTMLANILPSYHRHYLNNGYSLKWHIKIPKDYFETHYPEDPAGAEARLYTDLDEMLSGKENSGKAIITKYAKTYDGKPTDSWVFEALKGDDGDKATTDRHAQAMTSQLMGHGLAPSLAGLETQGKLSSGSEMRLAYNIYIALKTPSVRRILLEPLRIMQRIAGWDPSIKMGVKNIVLTTLDEGSGGLQNMTT